MHRFIYYPALYLDIVYVYTPLSCYIAHVSKLHTQAPVNVEFADWKLTEAVFLQCWWMNTYLQDGTIFCNHSGILNQLMIVKFTADIKRTKTSICCLIVGLLQC